MKAKIAIILAMFFFVLSNEAIAQKEQLKKKVSVRSDTLLKSDKIENNTLYIGDGGILFLRKLSVKIDSFFITDSTNSPVKVSKRTKVFVDTLVNSNETVLISGTNADVSKFKIYNLGDKLYARARLGEISDNVFVADKKNAYWRPARIAWTDILGEEKKVIVLNIKEAENELISIEAIIDNGSRDIFYFTPGSDNSLLYTKK